MPQIHLYKILLGQFASVNLSLIFQPITLETMLNYAHKFIKIRLKFSTRLISETKTVNPNFYFISETGISLSVRSRSLKKTGYRVEIFCANVFKWENVSRRQITLRSRMFRTILENITQ